MKILNLYAGLGGNRKLWNWTDLEVTAVENNNDIAEVYRSQFPQDEVIIDDAHEYLLNHYSEFDFIWSSPPCQSHSRMNKATRHNTVRYIDMSLYQEIILLKNFFEGKWVVENVNPYYDPLIRATKIGRHLFWSNFFINANFNAPAFPGFITGDSPEEIQQIKDWLGIQYDKNIYYGDNHSPAQILRNCVHPELGKYIFEMQDWSSQTLINF